MDTLEKGRNMKKVGILGGTGEIGKRVVKLLENQYELLVSYHSVKPSVTAHNQYIQLDVDISDDLESFCSQCSIIVNCAGASFVNGEKIARAAAKYHIPVVDPSVSHWRNSSATSSYSPPVSHNAFTVISPLPHLEIYSIYCCNRSSLT